MERKENQSNRVGFNPAAAMQGLMIANNLNEELKQNKAQKRKKMQEIVGIESVEEGDDNYKMANNEFVMLNDASNNMNEDKNKKDEKEKQSSMDYNEDILDLD